MKYLFAFLIVTTTPPAFSHSVSPSEGGLCGEKDYGATIIGVDGKILNCVNSDQKWKIAEQKIGDTCYTLKPDQEVVASSGMKMICRGGKLSEISAISKQSRKTP